MFSFFKKKPTPIPPNSDAAGVADADDTVKTAALPVSTPLPNRPLVSAPAPAPLSAPAAVPAAAMPGARARSFGAAAAKATAASAASTATATALPVRPVLPVPLAAAQESIEAVDIVDLAAVTGDSPAPGAAARTHWVNRLKQGLRKTGSSISTVFTGTRINEALYEELEEALLMADAGVKATQWLLTDLQRRVKQSKTTDPAAVKGLLADALTDLLRPLEKPLVIGKHTPTVIMVAGVNGAGKTTSIGKLTKHLAQAGAGVLLAAADTFRAAAREQLGVWADRNLVDIVSQEGGDPAAVSFDAVTAGKARRKDVVLVDTAGRLPTQLHLMEELKKIRRVVTKADATAPHEVLQVIDGNTGQNALGQVRAFDEALQLTGLIVTKLDGTAKGGVLAAIAQERPIPVYFIGVGEKLEDLETFNAREFAQALLA